MRLFNRKKEPDVPSLTEEQIKFKEMVASCREQWYSIMDLLPRASTLTELTGLLDDADTIRYVWATLISSFENCPPSYPSPDGVDWTEYISAKETIRRVREAILIRNELN